MSSSDNPLTDVRVDPRRYHESVQGERTEVRPSAGLPLSEVTNAA
jgi:hypothetical protein